MKKSSLLLLLTISSFANAGFITLAGADMLKKRLADDDLFVDFDEKTNMVDQVAGKEFDIEHITAQLHFALTNLPNINAEINRTEIGMEVRYKKLLTIFLKEHPEELKQYVDWRDAELKKNFYCR